MLADHSKLVLLEELGDSIRRWHPFLKTLADDSAGAADITCSEAALEDFVIRIEEHLEAARARQMAQPFRGAKTGKRFTSHSLLQVLFLADMLKNKDTVKQCCQSVLSYF